eukprot:3899756-Lingulodinium_polyedra.AAC.1
MGPCCRAVAVAERPSSTGHPVKRLVRGARCRKSNVLQAGVVVGRRDALVCLMGFICHRSLSKMSYMAYSKM